MTIWDARVRVPRRMSGSDSLIQEPACMARYDQILGTGASINRTLDDLVAEMDDAGVDGAIMHAEYEYGMLADELNRGVAEIVLRYPQKFVGFGTVTMEPFDIMKSLDELKRNLEAYGFRGINIEPSFFGVSPAERRFYPLYAWACDVHMPVALHAGVNYSVIHPIKNDHPLLFDEIACDFPDLTLIACHGGWPWTTQNGSGSAEARTDFLRFRWAGTQIPAL
jgi:predicted TIM-barrel fold metal-dependent hydrolase